MDPVPPDDLTERIELTDGRVVVLRPIVPDDEPAYRTFTMTLSAEAQYYRFFSPRRELSEREIEHFIRVDYVDRLAIIAVHDATIVGIARYDRETDPTLAEVAFILVDQFQGFGLAGRMLHLLAKGAKRNGIHRLVASVLPDNHKMQRVFSKSGLLIGRHLADGIVAVTMGVDIADAHPSPAPVTGAPDAAADADAVQRPLGDVGKE